MRARSSGSVHEAATRRVVLLVAIGIAMARPVPAAGGAAPQGRRPVRSMLELRLDRVVKQGWDVSCGAAALSTVFTYDYRDPVAEAEIVRALLKSTDPERVRARRGFSLLDLKRYTVARGYSAEGYGKLDPAGLARLAPAIVPLSVGELNHFVVVRGVTPDRVLLADPGFGTRTMPVEEFVRRWPSRIAFVVRRPAGSPGAPGATALVPARVVRHTIGAQP